MLNLEKKYADIANRVIPQAAKRSLIDGRKVATSTSAKVVTSRHRARVITKKEVTTEIEKRTRNYLTSANVDSMRIVFNYPTKAFGLLRFVVGRKTPAKQKGVKIKDRKKVIIRVHNSNTTLEKAFIAKGRGNKFHVFTRVGNHGKNRGKMVRHATPSIAFYVKKHMDEVIKPTSKRIQNSFARNFSVLSKQINIK